MSSATVTRPQRRADAAACVQRHRDAAQGRERPTVRLAQRRTGIPVVDSPLPANPKESPSFRGPATRRSCLLTGPVGDPDGMRCNQPYRACNQHSYLADVKHNTAVWVLVWVFA